MELFREFDYSVVLIYYVIANFSIAQRALGDSFIDLRILEYLYFLRSSLGFFSKIFYIFKTMRYFLKRRGGYDEVFYCFKKSKKN